MPEYANSAGRILQVFSALSSRGVDTHVKFDLSKAADAFAVRAAWAAIFQAVADLYNEYHTLESDILQFDETTPKFRLIRDHLPDILAVLTSMQVDPTGGTLQVTVSKVSLFALTWVAADLPQEEHAAAEELQRIRDLVDELRAEIEGATDFSRSVREWLLDLVRIIRDSLDRYTIRGTKGMREQFSILVGELHHNWATTEKVKEKSPGMWKKFTAALDVVYKIAWLSDRSGVAIEYVQGYLPNVANVITSGDLPPAPPAS